MPVLDPGITVTRKAGTGGFIWNATVQEVSKPLTSKASSDRALYDAKLYLMQYYTTMQHVLRIFSFLSQTQQHTMEQSHKDLRASTAAFIG
jgi:hypothetical protein